MKNVTRRGIATLAAFCAVTLALSVVRPAWSQTENKKERSVYRIGGDILPPRVVSKTDPNYTQEAKDARIQGTVVLSLVVNEDGKAEDIEVVRGIDPGLDLNAVDALGKWQFDPATKDGKPVAVQATIEVNFKLK